MEKLGIMMGVTTTHEMLLLTHERTSPAELLVSVPGYDFLDARREPRSRFPGSAFQGAYHRLAAPQSGSQARLGPAKFVHSDGTHYLRSGFVGYSHADGSTPAICQRARTIRGCDGER